MSFSSLADDMTKMLDTAETPSTEDFCIYKVPSVIRKHNEDAYTPNFVSIGPFHHGQPQLQNMERRKLTYFKDFLQRTNNVSLNTLITNIESILPQFKRCYSETLPLFSDQNELVKLILIDSGFIIQLFWQYFEKKYVVPWLDAGIRSDLLLLENQLPFFVIEKIYSLSLSSTNASVPNTDFLKLTTYYFDYYNKSKLSVDKGDITSIRHFTDLIRKFHFQHPIKSRRNSDEIEERRHLIEIRPNSDQIEERRHLIEIQPNSDENEERRHLIEIRPNSDENEERRHVPSATELLEAGVRFKVNTKSKCLLDLEFSGGVLKIPRLIVEGGTEILFRNMVALEQCHYPGESYITDYVVVLDFLINTGKDADILVRNEILSNLLGDSVPVAHLFNGLCKNVINNISSPQFSNLCKKLNAYYKNPWHKWKVALRRDYFKTPWQTAASVAGILLLVLTLVQSVFSILQAVQAS